MENGRLSVIYCRQGVGEVLILMKEISLGVLEGEHPDTLWSVAPLAWIYRGRGRYKEGNKLEVHVKGIERRIFKCRILFNSTRFTLLL